MSLYVPLPFIYFCLSYCFKMLRGTWLLLKTRLDKSATNYSFAGVISGFWEGCLVFCWCLIWHLFDYDVCHTSVNFACLTTCLADSTFDRPRDFLGTGSLWRKARFVPRPGHPWFGLSFNIGSGARRKGLAPR